MNNTNKLISWLSKAWPFIAIILFASVHYNILRIVPLDTFKIINKYVSSFAQIIGGLIVLFSINSNLGLFEQNNLFQLFLNWIKSFPLFQKFEPISGHANFVMKAPSISSEGHTGVVCKTVEEKIEEAQRQINELRNILYRKESELLTQIRGTEQSLKELIYKNQNDINALNGLVRKTTIGGINTQIFGVLLVVYGAVVPLIFDI